MTVKIVTFTGNNGSGAIFIADLVAGDQVLSVVASSGLPVGQDETSEFAAFILTDGQISQITAGDLSGYGFTALVQRHVVIP